VTTKEALEIARNRDKRSSERVRFAAMHRFACLVAAWLALVLVLSSQSGMALAQDKAGKGAATTSALITRAQDMFDDQRYEESIQTLSGALVRPGTSTEERVAIYKLLAFNYITLGKTDEADASVRGLLVLDETYELSAKESPRFRDFFKKTREAWEGEGKPGKAAVGETPKVDKPIKLTHAPLAQVTPNTAIKIEGKIDDPDARVAKVELVFRAGGEEKWSAPRPLIFAMGAFRGDIKDTEVLPPFVEYYILALDKDGLPLAGRGDVDAPLRVVVPDDEGGSVVESPWFWIPIGVTVAAGAILTGVLVANAGDENPTTRTATILITITE
jgi:hypothetical protein